eukprot:CAMPEP_0116013508 /NCGR_PEP_ID=MMETSP0321-20121206/5766_1 /TAXON_ID=163516 /ORGANISM="Leptocylindrus danicus var. danicus, Strain B650" /LENGTH=164 /DNA_ID=CAMNT_0003483067 /DNA_START=323 /DNA_END=817 /DNA_ORIENTATION=+
MAPTAKKTTTALLAAAAILASGTEAAFGTTGASHVQPNTVSSLAQAQRRGPQHSALHMLYVPPQSNSPSNSRGGSTLNYSSDYVDAESSTIDSDTLPQFKTAHGLLSPKTVRKLEENYHVNMSEEVGYFLKMYKEQGPMACVSVLSDPRVLPELTKAMRESVIE